MVVEEAVTTLLKCAGSDLSPEMRALLPRDSESLSEPHLELATDRGAAAVGGFFEAATDGIEFVPSERIVEQFGTTLADNYPEAGPAFLRMATSYWTLKIVLSDAWDERGTLGYSILSSIESNVGALFFPTPGPVRIDPDQRARDQRAYLEVVAPRMDIDDFIANNPIIRRDRGSQGAGCLVIPFLLVSRALEGIQLPWA